jgi:ABC-2 type transport system permease protein
MVNQTSTVAVRVLRQISHDRRFVMISLVVPVAVIYMLWIFFDASPDSPLFEVKTFVPPIAAFIVHFITYALCAIVLVRERTAHTLARMFVSGYRRGSIIGGYVLAYSLIATLQSLIVLVELNTLFEMNYALNTFLSLYGVIWMMAVISIALGILISNFARNEGQVLPTIPLVIMPSVFFSGMVMSVDKLPGWAATLGLATPMYYANEVIQSIISDAGNSAMIVALLVYGLVVMTLAVLTLSEQE